MPPRLSKVARVTMVLAILPFVVNGACATHAVTRGDGILLWMLTGVLSCVAGIVAAFNARRIARTDMKVGVRLSIVASIVGIFSPFIAAGIALGLQEQMR
jgi:hypothetical protein